MNQKSKKNQKKDKRSEKPTLTEVLVYSKRNESQLCSLLADDVVVSRQIQVWTKQQEDRRNKLARQESLLNARDQDIQVRDKKFRVEMKSLSVKENQLDKELFSIEEVAKNTAKDVLGIALQALIFQDEDSGDKQTFNSMLKKRWEIALQANGISVPQVGTSDKIPDPSEKESGPYKKEGEEEPQALAPEPEKIKDPLPEEARAEG